MPDLSHIEHSNLQTHLDEAHACSERALWVLYRDLRIKRPDLKEALESAFLDHAGFLEDSSIPGLRGAARLAIRNNLANQLKDRVAKEWGEDLIGLTVHNPVTGQYAMFLPCASSEGDVRASLFDERGFLSHITRKGYSEALDEIASQGFVIEAPGALEKLSQEQSFQEGNAFWSRGPAL